MWLSVKGAKGTRLPHVGHLQLLVEIAGVVHPTVNIMKSSYRIEKLIEKPKKEETFCQVESFKIIQERSPRTVLGTPGDACQVLCH